jgi:hypothetical protein
LTGRKEEAPLSQFCPLRKTGISSACFTIAGQPIPGKVFFGQLHYFGTSSRVRGVEGHQHLLVKWRATAIVRCVILSLSWLCHRLPAGRAGQTNKSDSRAANKIGIMHPFEPTRNKLTTTTEAWIWNLWSMSLVMEINSFFGLVFKLS